MFLYFSFNTICQFTIVSIYLRRRRSITYKLDWVETVDVKAALSNDDKNSNGRLPKET